MIKEKKFVIIKNIGTAIVQIESAVGKISQTYSLDYENIGPTRDDAEAVITRVLKHESAEFSRESNHYFGQKGLEKALAEYKKGLGILGGRQAWETIKDLEKIEALEFIEYEESDHAKIRNHFQSLESTDLIPFKK
jgi:hypothetical protein